jgi:uroporphyrinogen-III decarboxylase
MKPDWSSRERLMAAINRQQPDYTPCAFMMYNALRYSCRNYAEFIERQVEIGLDTVVDLPPREPLLVNDYFNLRGLPVSYDPAVAVKEWKAFPVEGEEFPILFKDYQTPAGTLHTEVRQTEDWRWGDHIPFLDDYIIPRARQFPIKSQSDLQALRYLLTPLKAEEIKAYHQDARPCIDQARRHALLISGGWGVGADLLGWIFGFENLIFAVYDQPDFIQEMLDIVAQWNRQRMQVMLDDEIDLYIKRAWYENCDFWTPKTWKKFIFPILKADTDLAHQAGKKFGYIITSKAMPLLEMIAEAGVDVIIGVDPNEWDLSAARQKLNQKVCLWGGVNGHLTVELGSTEAVQAEVDKAMQILAPGGGFILSPVDNIREDTPTSRKNVATLIKQWQQYIPA